MRSTGGGWRSTGVGLLVVAGAAGGLAGSAWALRPLVEFPTLSAGGSVRGIALGPDGNLWFLDGNTTRVGRITPAGVVTEFSEGLTPGGGLDAGVTAGPDGNVWFTMGLADRIGRITPAGVVTEFSSGITPGSAPDGITAGPDGNLWFAEAAGRIGRITPAGVVTEFGSGISPGSSPRGITVGPDGNLWFTDQGGDRIGRITPAGVVTEFSSGITPGSGPWGIAAGPDGNLWFTEFDGNRIGRITPAGVVTEFSTGITPASQPAEITVGPDGHLWFTENAASRVGVMTVHGAVVAEWVLPAGRFPRGIARGPGGLWLANEGGGRVALVRAAGEPADFDGDGRADLVAAQGPGGTALVRVLRGTDGAELFALQAPGAPLRGASAPVAACDLTGDGVPELILGSGPREGPHVQVFDGATGALVPGPRGSFLAYPPARMGVLVGCADVDGDGVPDIIAGPGAGGAGLPVRVFSGVDGGELGSVQPFDPAFRGAVFVGP